MQPNLLRLRRCRRSSDSAKVEAPEEIVTRAHAFSGLRGRPQTCTGGLSPETVRRGSYGKPPANFSISPTEMITTAKRPHRQVVNE